MVVTPRGVSELRLPGLTESHEVDSSHLVNNRRGLALPAEMLKLPLSCAPVGIKQVHTSTS